MRIAAVVDIHGNLPALEAVLSDIARIGADHTVFCGDFAVGAPDDRACYLLAKDTGAPIVRGNTDRYVAEFGTERADPMWTTEQFGPLQFSVSRFSDAERAELGALPTCYRLPEAPEILFYHANPRNDTDVVRSWTRDEDLAKNFEGVDGDVFVGGHIHTQYVREWRERRIVVCGSVGATNDYSAGAQYVLMEKAGGRWRIEHKDVPYDVTRTLRRFEDTQYLQKSGPIGRLFVRGVATGTNQLMPFLRWYGASGNNTGLTEAVDRFLMLY